MNKIYYNVNFFQKKFQDVEILKDDLKAKEKTIADLLKVFLFLIQSL